MNRISLMCSVLIIVMLNSCNDSYDVEQTFENSQQQDSVLLKLSPYIIRQPEEVSDSLWYSTATDSLRRHKLSVAHTTLYKYHQVFDTIYYGVYQKDLRSLHEDYRGYGGKYLVKEGTVSELEELFITPQLKMDEVKEVTNELFDEIVVSGNALKYLDNAVKMQWPSTTVIYNVEKKKWEITEANDYYFLQKMKDSVAQSNGY